MRREKEVMLESEREKEFRILSMGKNVNSFLICGRYLTTPFFGVLLIISFLKKKPKSHLYSNSLNDKTSLV